MNLANLVFFIRVACVQLLMTLKTRPQFQNEPKREAIDTYFHKGSLVLSLVVKARVFVTQKWHVGERDRGGGGGVGCTRDALHGIRLLYKISKRLILDYS